jgi:hypothetical protein
VTGRLGRLFWVGAAAILVAAALVSIAALVRGDLGETDGKILLTLLALLVGGGTALCGLALLERGAPPWVGWTVVVTAVSGFALVTAATWDGYDSDTLARLAGTAAAVVVAVLVVVTQVLLLGDPRLRALVAGTAVALGVAVAILSVGIWTDDLGESGGKAVAVLTILGALGWVLVPVLQRLGGAERQPGDGGRDRVITTLGGIDVVATTRPGGDAVTVEPSREGLVIRSSGAAVRLRPGEHVALRSHRRP